MGVLLRYRDFNRQLAVVTQGVFWLESDSWSPQNLKRLNVGLALSEQLMLLPIQERKNHVVPILSQLIGTNKAVILENIEVLFLPSLETDVLALMVSLARNRILYLVWPCQIDENLLSYAVPSSSEYVSYDLIKYLDTYVITR